MPARAVSPARCAWRAAYRAVRLRRVDRRCRVLAYRAAAQAGAKAADALVLAMLALAAARWAMVAR